MASYNHRLLYRGALELPDSYLLLDGLSLTLLLNAKDSRPTTDLLQNPLALALESMRGRPSLQFLGTAKVGDVCVDSSCHANVFVHPGSILTQTCFQNMFCLSPINAAAGKTEYGIRVGLGDQDVPGSSEILIYGQLSSGLSPELQLLATRIVPAPPPKIRLPRPDDPTPRQPPLIASSQKRMKPSKKVNEEHVAKRPKDVMRKIPKGIQSSSVEDFTESGSKNAFKVPEIPHRFNGRLNKVADVFGSSSAPKDESDRRVIDVDSEDIDKRNKAEVKKSAVRCLAKHGINKEHREWKDLFGYVYRGASFALRLHMTSKVLDANVIDELVSTHVHLYVRGDGVLVKS